MDPEHFAASVRTVAFDGAVNTVLKNLEQPPGRVPPAAMQRASAWFNDLSADDKSCVRFVVPRHTAHAAVFGLLCLLDGVRAFDEDHGTLQLHYVAPDGTTTKLNPDDDDLHDMFNTLVHPAHEPLEL